MAHARSLLGLLHEATHRIPGVAVHTERPPGHQGTAVHGHARRPAGGAAHRTHHQRWNHSAPRSSRFMPAWQHRIAALFSRER